MDARILHSDSFSISRMTSEAYYESSPVAEEWLCDAKHAGLWTVGVDDHLYEGFEKSNELKWIADSTLSAQVNCICTNGSRVWVVDDSGQVHVRLQPQKQAQQGTIIVEICENQRHMAGSWGSDLLPTDRAPWSDVTGKQRLSKTDFTLPSSRWKWSSEWAFTRTEHTDQDGWQYAHNFPSKYHSSQEFNDWVRRRMWYRHRHTLPMITQWTTLTAEEGVRMVSVGLYGDVVWAISEDQKVYRRINVSATQPEGESWQRIDFVGKTSNAVTEPTISVCSPTLVLVLLQNGSLHRRLGISASVPDGLCWASMSNRSPIKRVCGTDSMVCVLTVDHKINVMRGKFTDQLAPMWEIITPPPTACFQFKSIAINHDCAIFALSTDSEIFRQSQGGQWCRLAAGPTQWTTVAASPSTYAPLTRVSREPWQADLLRLLQQRDLKIQEGIDMALYCILPEKKIVVSSHVRGFLKMSVGKEWKRTLFQMHRSHKRLYFETRTRAQDQDTPINVEIAKSIGYDQILSIEPQTQNRELPYPFNINLKKTSAANDHEPGSGEIILLCAESETERSTWVSSLQAAINGLRTLARIDRYVMTSSLGHASLDAMWALAENGSVWFCNHEWLKDLVHGAIIWARYPGYPKSRSHGRALGWFRDLKVSNTGVVWALGDNECLYACDHSSQSWLPVHSFSRKRVQIISYCITVNAVWVITSTGLVYVRSNVNPTCVTVTDWLLVPASPICQVMTTPTGIFAIHTESRELLRRGGFSGVHPHGTHWCSLDETILLAEQNIDADAGLIKVMNAKRPTTAWVVDVVQGKDAFFTIMSNGSVVSKSANDEHVVTLDRKFTVLSATSHGVVYGLSESKQFLFWDQVAELQSQEWVNLPSHRPPSFNSPFIKFSAAAIDCRSASHSQPVPSTHVRCGDGQVRSKSITERVRQFQPGQKVIAAVRSDSDFRRVTVMSTCQFDMANEHFVFVQVQEQFKPNGYWALSSTVSEDIPIPTTQLQLHTLVLAPVANSPDLFNTAQLVAKLDATRCQVVLTRTKLALADLQSLPKVEQVIQSLRALPE